MQIRRGQTQSAVQRLCVSWNGKSPIKNKHGNDAYTKAPKYVAEAKVDDMLTGLPYCWGGFDGFGKYESVYKEKAAGNVLCATINGKAYKPETVGVDCSGFVSSAFALTSKEGTSGLISYGYTIEYEKMKEGDIFVRTRNPHCMIFSSMGYDPDGNVIVWVYDCTTDTNKQNASYRYVTKAYADQYTRLSPYDHYYNGYQKSDIDIYHWRLCTVCGETTVLAKHKTTSSNPYYCSVCGYIPAVATNLSMPIPESDIGIVALSAD